MKYSPRQKMVEIQKSKLNITIGQWFKDCPVELTTAEEIYIITSVFQGLILGTANLMIKEERGESTD